MTGRLTLALLLAATPACAWAQGTTTTLAQAWEAARTHDPDILAAEAQRQADDEAAAQARALARPQVQAQGELTGTHSRVDVTLPADLDADFDGSQNGGRGSVGVQAVLPIYDLGNRADMDQLRSRTAAGRYRYAGEAQALVLRVAQAYLDVVEGEELVASYAAQQQAAERQRQSAQARFDAGRARITDVREAEAQRDAAMAQQLSAQAQLAFVQGAYAELVGLAPVGLHHVATDLPVQPPSQPLAEVAALAEQDAPAVRIAAQSARAAAAEIDRYAPRGLPVVEGVAGYQDQFRIGGSSDSGILPDRLQAASAGVRLTIPLYAGGAIASRRREAMAGASQADRELDAARRDARLAAQQAWHGVASGAARVAALRTAPASAELQEQAATTGLRVGVRTQTDLLNAQAQAYATRRDLVAQIHDYLLAHLQLAAATAQLDGADLAALDRLIGQNPAQ